MPIGLNSLLLENSDFSSVVDNNIENVCFTNSMLGILTEMNNDFREANKEYYRSIYEADSLVAVNESFSDFFEKIKEIIKKFLRYIKNLFDRFITTLHRMVGSEKYLLKSETGDKLKKFNSEHEFEFDGYTFTIEPNIPICNALAEFNQKFVGIDFRNLNSNKKSDSDKRDDIKNANKDLKNKLEASGYDELRAQVIGKTGSIYQSEFNNELFELFRDGADNTSIFTVTNSIVLECYNSLKNYKSTEKDISAKKKEIENEYNAILKQLDHMISTERNGTRYKVKLDDNIYGDELDLDNETMNQLNLYVKTLTNQVTEMSTMHGTAFSYKLDALKDKYNQDKRILYIALSKVEKDKKFRAGEI